MRRALVSQQVSPTPWWIARVTALLSPRDLSALEVNGRWRLCEQLHFVRQYLDPAARCGSWRSCNAGAAPPLYRCTA